MLEIRNNLDWLLKILVLEVFAFSARIHFLDLALFGLLVGLYDFSVLIFFYLYLFRFFYHPALHFLPLLRLLDLVLRFFSV